ncbi:LamG-like jellyroll fold domain-containing protein [Parasediminibacterium paludis]|uniref:LamG-like jellyroll fold domain-containing protein n=1 Tax=Parasediminibacterium paludis TaxID=908966 RepID=A0ABV8PYS1_9BACT
MNKKYLIANYVGLILTFGLIITGCQKIDHPVLGDYPKDANAPGGPLKFYAALDGKAVDSIRANFGIDNNTSYVPGVNGLAVQLNGSKNGYVSFPSANDFGNSSSFSISYWINITLAQKDNNHAVGVLSFANAKNFWGNITFYADNNTKGNTDSMDLKIHFGDVNNGDNWNFAGYNFTKAWPHMYDGKWHQIGFTYDASTLTGIVYRDGVQFDMKTNQHIVFENPSQVILGGFQEAAGVVDSYSNNTWMAGFPGIIDQVRLYGVALSPTDMAALYTNKQ